MGSNQDNFWMGYEMGYGEMPEENFCFGDGCFAELEDVIASMNCTNADPEGPENPEKNSEHAADCHDRYADSQAFVPKEKGTLSRLEIVVSEFYQVREKYERETSPKVLYEIMSKVTAKALMEYVSENYSEIETVVFYGAESLPAQRIILYICEYLSDVLKGRPNYRLMCDSIYHMQIYLEEIRQYHVAISDNYGMGAYNSDFYETNKRFCQAGFKRLVVGTNGDIYPCYGTRNTDLWKMGTIFDRNWEDGELCQKVRNLMVRIYCKSRCEECIWSCSWCIAKLITRRKEDEDTYGS